MVSVQCRSWDTEQFGCWLSVWRSLQVSVTWWRILRELNWPIQQMVGDRQCVVTVISTEEFLIIHWLLIHFGSFFLFSKAKNLEGSGKRWNHTTEEEEARRKQLTTEQKGEMTQKNLYNYLRQSCFQELMKVGEWTGETGMKYTLTSHFIYLASTGLDHLLPSEQP